MIINRHNYEEFFILYMDNELNSQQRGEVEAFAAANPDLKAELDILLQSRLVPDTSISFAAKDELLRSSTNIDMTNYEEWLLLYIDNELDAEQKATVEDFIIRHPAVQDELILFQQAKLQPETAIVFPNKESLYRKEEKSRRVVMMRWTRIAVAAILLLAVSLSVYFISNNKTETTGPALAGINQPADTNTVNPERNSVSTDLPKETIVSVDQAKDPIDIKKENAAVAIKKKDTEEKIHRNIDPQTKDDTRLIAQAEPLTDNGSDLPEPRNIRKPMGDSATVLANLNENNSVKYVTSGQFTAYNLAVNKTTQPDNEIVDADQPEKKSKLRGLLRKITRTIEKTTNLKTTDDENRLLVAGFAVQL
jgi:hypothetical protein